MGCTPSAYAVDDVVVRDDETQDTFKQDEQRDPLRTRTVHSSARTTLTSVAEDAQLTEEADRDNAKREQTKQIYTKQLVVNAAFARRF